MASPVIPGHFNTIFNRLFRSTLLRVSTPTSSEALTIGDLAERTGLTPATLRVWESRHGFPRPARLESGHRRYGERDVDLVLQVLRRRDSGSRLEVAIASVLLAAASVTDPPAAPSVYATMRRLQPTLAPQRLRKSTLLALSWAIEDECCSRAENPMIFGAFQQERYYRAAEERWTELARVARCTMVFAGFPGSGSGTAGSGSGSDSDEPREAGGTVFVRLPGDAPMRQEWAVVCDAPNYPAMLTAWELPGQSSVADSQRLFECIWTVEPRAVREAARTCAQVARQLGIADAAPLLYELADDPPPPPPELLQASALLNRVVAYVDSAR
jgi:DICT domain-containing protein/predicted DNA-binding transcriptional regulator AlpA